MRTWICLALLVILVGTGVPSHAENDATERPPSTQELIESLLGNESSRTFSLFDKGDATLIRYADAYGIRLATLDYEIVRTRAGEILHGHLKPEPRDCGRAYEMDRAIFTQIVEILAGRRTLDIPPTPPGMEHLGQPMSDLELSLVRGGPCGPDAPQSRNLLEEATRWRRPFP